MPSKRRNAGHFGRGELNPRSKLKATGDLSQRLRSLAAALDNSLLTEEDVHAELNVIIGDGAGVGDDCGAAGGSTTLQCAADNIQRCGHPECNYVLVQNGLRT
jgi:hypothetical protein